MTMNTNETGDTMDALYDNTNADDGVGYEPEPTPFDDPSFDDVGPDRTVGDAADECRAILAAEDLENIDEIPIVSPCAPMDVEVELGDAAIAAKGRALVSLLARIEDKHAEKKEAMSVFKTEIEALEIERDGLARDIETAKALVKVECERRSYPLRKIAQIVRRDTGEVLRTTGIGEAPEKVASSDEPHDEALPMVIPPVPPVLMFGARTNDGLIVRLNEQQARAVQSVLDRGVVDSQVTLEDGKTVRVVAILDVLPSSPPKPVEPPARRLVGKDTEGREWRLSDTNAQLWRETKEGETCDVGVVVREPGEPDRTEIVTLVDVWDETEEVAPPAETSASATATQDAMVETIAGLGTLEEVRAWFAETKDSRKALPIGPRSHVRKVAQERFKSLGGKGVLR